MTVRPSTDARSLADADLRRIARDLSSRIEGEIRFGRHDRMLYATDASIYQVQPVGVVIPASLQDVQRTVDFCAERGLPILPRGGGTSLAGQAVNAAIVIDFSAACNALLGVDEAAQEARVEPGIVLDHLNRALAARGLMFGPDVATSTHATLGGMIGNNSAGAHSILYGRTVEHVRGLEVLLADGQRVHLDEGAAQRDERVRDLTQRIADVIVPLEEEIRRRYPRTRRRVNGYNLDLIAEQLHASTTGTFDRVNLAHLLCGSEGTLGVTMEATLGLVKTPRCKGLAIVAFADVDAALHAVAPILETRPAAVELVDDTIITLAKENLEHRRYVDLLPTPDGRTARAVLYVEYFTDGAAEIEASFAQLEEEWGRDAIQCHLDPTSIEGAWRLRKAGEPLLHGLLGTRKPITFIEDLAVDPDRLPEFIARIRQLIAAHGTTAAYYAHASVGCLHIRPLICLKDDDDVRVMQEIAGEATDLVMEFGGALSGEHGDGRLRSHLLRRFYGEAICEAFGAIKAIFDPENRLNPGIITDPPPMTAQWRVRPDEKIIEAPDVQTFFRFQREHGLGGAAEMCNGAGMCRKTDGGTMCPSYRVTHDERHSTRGRGNALRLAVTGQLSIDGRTPAWNDPETLATLDLCLSCKACKSECPSNVDVARLKAEYLARSYRHAGRAPLRPRVFGRIRRLNRIASIAPRLANGLGRNIMVRAIINRMLGIDARRSLPTFAPSLYRWMRRRRSAAPDDAPVVVLMPDCFTVYNEPHVGRAAVRALEALGYRVVLPRAGCCGRSLISNGLLAEAIVTCRATAASILSCVESHDAVAVVGCEPSCISAITDDWLDLDLGLERTRLEFLAGRSMLIEDFIETRWERHPERPSMKMGTDPASVLLHGHCHQKALGDVQPTLNLLRRLRGGEVRLIEAGCCGMAGAFGFTREHFDVSMRIAEQSLLPEIRAAEGEEVIAPGTSCRHQVRDATGRGVRHPIELIAEALTGAS